ncbi:family 20 glycosylhydrolase [Pedobacter sp. ASV1-7]|uniref:beta-N-acetylhexosaminidase n=1 Tax=Pedobacter sp. ASV1-7 TaxID=3145237 RepID=UPI0032E8B5E5
MRIVIILLLLNIFFVKEGICVSDTTNIIPRPLYYKRTQGNFNINNKTVIYVEPGQADLKSTGNQLSAHIYKITGLKLPVLQKEPGMKSGFINLTTKGAVDSLGAEGYLLKSSSNSVVISSKNAQGVFYGIQTIIQMINKKNSLYQIPSAKVYDKPRFGWRGLMLDVGRYFYSVEFIKKMLDHMAIYKMNVFHWHLTEDQGWRIEILKYPELTQKGAWRSETQYARGGNRWVDKNPHGGFYTQDQIREVVKYAQSKFITIIPEIEMPGHSVAALSVFPALSCTGGPFDIPGQWKVEKEVYCAGNEQTFKFLEDVLTEVAALFPSNIIHIGGDECPKDRWKVCPKCQERIKKEGLKDEHELQSYFIRRMEKFLATKNKKIIGWDEILEGGLAPNAMVMSWRGTQGGIAAAKLKHEVVMSPNTYMYFDYYQGEHHMEPYAYGNLLPIQKVYGYEPVPSELNNAEKKYIKGVQANVWTEYIHSPESVEYMLFPRLAAVAEVGWTSNALKNWTDFSRRLEHEFIKYKAADINYAKSIYSVWCEAKIDTASAIADISLAAYNYKPEIRFTLDGTEPSMDSKLYTGTFKSKIPVTIKATTFKGGKRIGKVNTRSIAVILKKSDSNK